MAIGSAPTTTTLAATAAPRPGEALRFGVPQGKRFEGRALAHLEDCGLNVRRESERQLTAEIAGFPGVIAILQRARDILTQVAAGKLDIGITGLDLVHEFAAEGDDVQMLFEDLGFSVATIVVAVPESWIDVSTLADLAEVAIEMRERGQDLRVATTYPRLTQRFFYEKGITHFSIVPAEGGVEAAPNVGFADAIVDTRETGVSLTENHLKVLRNGEILRSQACLIGNGRALAASAEKRDLTRRIMELIEARLRAQGAYSVTANLHGSSEAEVAKALLRSPATRGRRGPTVARVYTADTGDSTGSGGWFAATIIVEAPVLQAAVDHLRAVGGSGISVVPVRYLFDERCHGYDATLAALRLSHG